MVQHAPTLACIFSDFGRLVESNCAGARSATTNAVTTVLATASLPFSARFACVDGMMRPAPNQAAVTHSGALACTLPVEYVRMLGGLFATDWAKELLSGTRQAGGRNA
eukprot:SAG11_NODE_2626_length_3163_cov_1.351175_5_plen_108_part_00